jgi:hypothetical protein
MRLFLDAEFTGLNKRAQLISLALVSEDNRWFYAEFTDYSVEELTIWHRTHVLPHLSLTGSNGGNPQRLLAWEVKGQTAIVQADLTLWLEQFVPPDQPLVDIWGDCLAYDWVLFCELFGGALHLPKHLFYMPFDLATLLKMKGVNPDVPREELAFTGNPPQSYRKHHALWDARMLKRCFERLMQEQ